MSVTVCVCVCVNKNKRIEIHISRLIVLFVFFLPEYTIWFACEGRTSERRSETKHPRLSARWLLGGLKGPPLKIGIFLLHHIWALESTPPPKQPHVHLAPGIPSSRAADTLPSLYLFMSDTLYSTKKLNVKNKLYGRRKEEREAIMFIIDWLLLP